MLGGLYPMGKDLARHGLRVFHALKEDDLPEAAAAGGLRWRITSLLR